MIRGQAIYMADAALPQSENTADAAVQAASTGHNELFTLCVLLLILLLAAIILLDFSALIWQKRIYKVTIDIRKQLSELSKKPDIPSEEHCPGPADAKPDSDGTRSGDSNVSLHPRIPSGEKTEEKKADRFLQQSAGDHRKNLAETKSDTEIREEEMEKSQPAPSDPSPTAADKTAPPYTPPPVQRYRVGRLKVNSEIYYNPSAKVSFDRNDHGHEPFELFSDNTVFPAPDCFLTSSTAALYLEQDFHHVFEFTTVNGDSAALTGRLKLLRTEQPAVIEYASGRIYLKQKGILIVEERQG